MVGGLVAKLCPIVTPQTVGFSWQEYWSQLPFPSPGDLPDPGIETRSPALQVDSLPPEPPGKLIIANSSSLFYFPVYIHAAN